MFRFHILHLLLLTTICAVAFAVARLLDYEFVLFFALVLAIFAPVVCYSIAEITSAGRRPVRVFVRRGLLFSTLTASFLISASYDGTNAGVTTLTVMLFFWIPQLVLLKFCSVNRQALVGAAV